VHDGAERNGVALEFAILGVDDEHLTLALQRDDLLRRSFLPRCSRRLDFDRREVGELDAARDACS
jgi:hypothetical protein